MEQSITGPSARLGETALAAATAGARAIGQVTAGGDLRVATKSSLRDLVTSADRAAEEAIIRVLRDRRPGDAVLGEESGEHPGKSGLRWLVDPLDGTMNFVHRRDDYAVSVGAELDGRYVAGAVLRPAFGDWVAAGEGSVTGSAGIPALCPTGEPSQMLVSVGFPQQAEHRPLVLDLVGRVASRVRDFRRIGSAACDLYHVATGRLDAQLAVGPFPWDVAGGWAVVSALGGRCIWVTSRSGLRIGLAGTASAVEVLEPLARET